MARVYHSNGERADHETPPALYWLLNRRHGFRLDAAATEATAKAPEYFTPAEDALSRPWSPDPWWLNPPYGSQNQIGDWLEKAAREGAAGRPGVALIPSRTETAWWWESVKGAEVHFLPGRLTFWLDGRPMPYAAGFPSAVVLYGYIGRPKFTEYWDWKTEFLRRAEDHGIPEGRLNLCHLRPAGTFHAPAWEVVEPWIAAKTAAGVVYVDPAWAAARAVEGRAWRVEEAREAGAVARSGLEVAG